MTTTRIFASSSLPVRFLALALVCCGGFTQAAPAPSSPSAADHIFGNDFTQTGFWLDVSGTDFWSCGANCDLVNGQFVEDGPGMTLIATEGWAGGLRPEAIRMYGTAYGKGELFSLGVGLLPGGTDFGTCQPYVVGSACELEVTSDIRRINAYMVEQVISIELYVDNSSQ